MFRRRILPPSRGLKSEPREKLTEICLLTYRPLLFIFWINLRPSRLSDTRMCLQTVGLCPSYAAVQHWDRNFLSPSVRNSDSSTFYSSPKLRQIAYNSEYESHYSVALFSGLNDIKNSYHECIWVLPMTVTKINFFSEFLKEGKFTVNIFLTFLMAYFRNWNFFPSFIPRDMKLFFFFTFFPRGFLQKARDV